MVDEDAAQFTAAIIAEATSRAVDAASKPVRTVLRRTVQSLTSAYRPFLYRTYTRVKSIRTFLRPNESVDLLTHYVPVDLQCGERDIDVIELVEELSRGKRYVVSALAGSGKSVLMRYIALAFFNNPRGRIPLFFELRNLNGGGGIPLLKAIHEFYRGNSSVEIDDFHAALRSGYFILILDGFDEIAPEDRAYYEKEIIKIARENDACPIVISGRSDDRFNSWEEFTHYELKAMSLSQTRQLIRSSNYEENVKNIFLERLTEDFFDRHESFLSNPLLSIMMMLTFEDYAEIPDSLHEFYRIAFDTLLRRHDALKDQFSRITHSSCSTEQFKQIFASFCMLTYSKSAFVFDRDKAIAFLRAVLLQQGLDKSPDVILADLIESICLLQQEGFEISFVHRSFQEYFCAVFIANSGAGFVNRYFEEAGVRPYDNVIPMLMGIAQQRVETEWANQKVNAILEEVRSSSDPELQLHLLAYPVMTFAVWPGRIVLLDIEESKLGRDLSILQSVYSQDWGAFFTDEGSDEVEDEIEGWDEGIAKALISLDDQNRQSLVEARSLVSLPEEEFTEIRRRDLQIELNRGDAPLYQAVFRKGFESRIKFLERVQGRQRLRDNRSERFLEEIFGSIEV